MSHSNAALVSRTVGTENGRQIVLLHGWGMNSGAFSAFIPFLANDIAVTTIDLPGYGENVNASPEHYTLDNLVRYVSDSIPANAVIAGWSLGGLVAQAIANQRSDLSAVITLASSPRFVAGQGWPGIDPDLLASFSSSLEQDYKKTVERFLAIQAMGSLSAKQDIKMIKKHVASHPTPCRRALKEGLTLLANEDLRHHLHTIKVPTLRIYGRRDSLVPVSAIDKVCELHPDSDTVVLPNASHAPFISHPEHTSNAILRFVSRAF